MLYIRMQEFSAVKYSGRVVSLAISVFLVACFNTNLFAKDILIDNIEYIDNYIENAEPGDELVLPDGVYKDICVRLSKSGTPKRKIFFRGENPGKTIITGRSMVVVTGDFIQISNLTFAKANNNCIVKFVGANGSRLTNSAFIDCGDLQSTYSHIVRLCDGSSENRIDHCYMDGNVSIGIGVLAIKGDALSNRNRIDHVYFANIKKLSNNGQESIQVGQTFYSFSQKTHTVVEYCLFENVKSDREIISNKTSCNTYRYNTFLNCLGALVVRGGDYVTVSGNYFYDTKDGIRVHGKNHKIFNNYIENVDVGIDMPTGTGDNPKIGLYPETCFCKIINNTIVNTNIAGIRMGFGLGRKKDGFAWTIPPHNNLIANNIISTNSGKVIVSICSNETEWKNNVVWVMSSATWGLRVYGQHSGFVYKSSCLNKIDGMFSPDDSSSPAVDSAIKYEWITDDIHGQKRGLKPDVGCVELPASKVSRQPLRRCNVGPSWM